MAAVLFVAACTLTASCTSGRADAREPSAPSMMFHALVTASQDVTLGAGDSVQMAMPVAVLTTPSHLIVLDRKRAEARMFARAGGALVRVIGTPGDESGMLRKPAAIAALDSGRFVILDEGRRLLSFRDSTGRVLNEARLPDGSFTSMVTAPAEHRVVLAGRLFYGADSVRDRELHEFDYQGKHIASYGVRTPTPTLWSRAFATALVGGSANDLVTATMASNRVRYVDRRTGTERSASIAAGWFKPLVFPSDNLLVHGATQESATSRVSAWSKQHRFLNGIFALAGDRILVRFQAFDPAGKRFYYYAVSNRDGTEYVMTRATRINVLEARGDTLTWIAGGAGKTMLGTGIVTTGPVALAAVASARAGIARTAIPDGALAIRSTGGEYATVSHHTTTPLRRTP